MELLEGRIYFICTNLGSDDDGDEDAEGDLATATKTTTAISGQNFPQGATAIQALYKT
jgi:hypothetical protein